MRILVVEDDQNIADVLRRGLVEQHYSVDVAGDGQTGAELALVNDYDLLILDIMLPGLDGRAVCRRVREEGLLTPILMLTALGSAGDVITGLDSGADDYLTKPFDYGVLLARVRSLTRRRSELRTTQVRVADLEIDTARRTVRRGETPINLTAKEFALLEYFVLHKGRVLSREAIGEHVWDINFDPRSNVIESLIRFLRQKIDVEGEDSLIQTIRGVGYRLDA
ncbi:MAG TPA: response regulator transcription factor [Candidatus Kapabacteria bacterium]|jgi:DNA-binding response OmpR family regulator|nr:response regulator transcription factor [Candidatus Kapabacteria bacterium]